MIPLNTNNRETIIQSQDGGKPLASGGFGCVFKPALKCKDKNKERKLTNQVSKLMLKKYAKKEYNDVVKFIPYLKKIPNYDKYFLIKDFSICQPDTLNEEDLDGFDSKCKNLVKKKFTRKNINEERKLSMLASVNMPYGGIDVGDYIEESKIKNKLNYEKLLVLNYCLLELLKNGILPMNEEHIYHCDLKDSNILVDENMNLKLIDWGISCKYDGEQSVPKVIQRRSFQYNLPFSNILFSDRFYDLYKKFLVKKKEPSYLDVREFVIDFVLLWLKERGPGHIKTISKIMKYLFEDTIKDINNEFKEHIIEYNYTFHFILEYITKILIKFTRNGEFDKIAYLNIFLKNIDIWGFTMSYIPIVEIIKNSKKITKLEVEVIEKIKDAVVFLYDYPDTIIDVNKLMNILKELNTIFKRGILIPNKRTSLKSTITSLSLKSTLKTMLREKSKTSRTAKGKKERKENKKNKTIKNKTTKNKTTKYRLKK